MMNPPFLLENHPFWMPEKSTLHLDTLAFGAPALPEESMEQSMPSMPLPTTKRDLLGLEWLSWVQVNGKIMREREICIYISLRLLLVLYNLIFYSIPTYANTQKYNIYIIQPPISWVCLRLGSTPRTPELTHGQLFIGKLRLQTTGWNRVFP